MRPIHLLTGAFLFLGGAETRSEQIILPAGTAITVEDGMRIQNRSQWIRQYLSKIILPNVTFEKEPLQDCLEFLRAKITLALSRAEQSDNHIHFLRCGPSQEDIRVTLKLTDTSVLEVCEELAKRIGAKLHIVDYGVLFEVALVPGNNKSRDNGDPFDQ